MSEDVNTRPTIETVLERINALGERMDKRFANVETTLEQMDTRLDRTQASVYEMRADFREFHA
jgi:predicted  nucleic acid-binding Zn-ribbon protein